MHTSNTFDDCSISLYRNGVSNSSPVKLVARQTPRKCVKSFSHTQKKANERGEDASDKNSHRDRKTLPKIGIFVDKFHF